MRNGNELRAALELLDWKYSDLAEKSDVSKATIAKLAQSKTRDELVAFNSRTLNKVIRTINNAGVRFTTFGVERDSYPVYFTEGKNHEDAYLKLLEDVYDHLLSVDNPELLIMYADDKVSPPSVNAVYKAMRQDGIKMRQMIKEGNTYIIGPLNEYRYIPAKMFINRVTLIYGDRIANETSDVLRGKISVDPIQAEIQRNNFNIMWQALEQPTESVADERFE